MIKLLIIWATMLAVSMICMIALIYIIGKGLEFVIDKVTDADDVIGVISYSVIVVSAALVIRWAFS